MSTRLELAAAPVVLALQVPCASSLLIGCIAAVVTPTLIGCR